MKSTIEALKSYQNDALIHRFLETWNLPWEEAQELFEETKKWLWLSAYSQERKGEAIELAISQSTKLIDEMWHTFILFSKDYHDFCEQYFGYYLHHYPTPKARYEQTITEYERSPETVIQKNRELFAAQYSLIYDVLGEATLLKWYSEYTDKYTDEYLQRIWQWSFSPYDSRVQKNLSLTSLAEGNYTE